MGKVWGEDLVLTVDLVDGAVDEDGCLDEVVLHFVILIEVVQMRCFVLMKPDSIPFDDADW